ncbi:MAG: hypothetical protein AAB553_08255 [Patescibacteria group bacterium]
MSLFDTIIILLLTIIAYFLYHIAKQLSYLTGRRIKISFFNKTLYQSLIQKRAPKENRKEPREPKLPN